MSSFSAMAKTATASGVLDKKTKELIDLAIGVATRCDRCIAFHAEALVNLVATKAEVEEMLAMYIYLSGGPSLMYEADALLSFEQMSEDKSA
jgi:AhpD family alkylhydroperoxidase